MSFLHRTPLLVRGKQRFFDWVTTEPLTDDELDAQEVRWALEHCAWCGAELPEELPTPSDDRTS